MQDELVRGFRQVMFRNAIEEEAFWGPLARPFVAARLRELADELE